MESEEALTEAEINERIEYELVAAQLIPFMLWLDATIMAPNENTIDLVVLNRAIEGLTKQCNKLAPLPFPETVAKLALLEAQVQVLRKIYSLIVARKEQIRITENQKKGTPGAQFLKGMGF